MSKRIEHKIIDGLGHKWCGSCKEWHPLYMFGAQSSAWDRQQYKCKACMEAYRLSNTPRTPTARIEHKMIAGVEHALCRTCKEWLPLDMLGDNITRWDGKSTKCRACVRKASGSKPRPPRIEHKMIDGVEHKWCSTCKEWHSLGMFGVGNAAWDKKNAKCKACVRKATGCKPRPPKIENKMIDGVEHKWCSTCKEWHSLDMFSMNNATKDKKATRCRACHSEYAKSDKRKAYNKGDRRKALRKINNQTAKSKARRKRYRDNPKRISEQSEYMKMYKHTEKGKASYKASQRKMLSTVEGRMRSSMSSRILGMLGGYFNGGKGSKKTIELIGYSIDELVIHLNNGEYTLDDYMDKMDDNGRKEFHIDHIIPCAYYQPYLVLEVLGDTFTPKGLEIFRKCWNPRNLRIWPASDNISKNDKLDMDLVREYGIKDLLVLD